MKLFQRLLVAPAALGLLAPMAVNATELNIDGVSDYAASGEQVTSITQFSDVSPTDWAYQALSNLIERYGCVAGYPNGTYRGNRAMTRFEAAALLNACLDRVTEVTDELKRLMKEFEKELAILKGRVDGLEARVGELEATQFSTTTKLKGQTTFVTGASTAGSSVSSAADDYNQSFGAVTFNYDLRLALDTSFTGKDLLRTRLRSGNFGNSVFGNGLTAMEVAFEEPSGANSVGIDRVFYQFPIGSSFTATVGARVRQDDMLAVWPSAYPADTILDIFTYAGAPGTYNLSLGAGAGLSWSNDGFSISANYVSINGQNSASGTGDPFNPCDDTTGGIGTDCSGSNGTVQVAYTADNWGIAAAYNYASGDNGVGLYSGNGTPTANLLQTGGANNSVGISAYWSPEESSWIPSISTGWGLNDNAGVDGLTKSSTSQSWYVGLQWSDVFLKGNSAGMAVGQATFVTAADFTDAGKAALGTDWVGDGNYAWEWWYKFQVTDNISVTPALFYLSAPRGYIFRIVNEKDDTFNNFGGLIKTTFTF